jgi:putative ATPase
MKEEDLFGAGLKADLAASGPLAARMRPQRLGEVVGQPHLLGEGAALRVAIATGTVSSMIFFGPPGTGKTTIARLVAAETGLAYEELSAVSSGVAEVRKVIDASRDRRAQTGRRTVLFIDEIHRFSKAQQDALLHAVEDGVVTLIGASTENPYFEVIPALISRCELYQFEPLPKADLRRLLDKALEQGGVGGGSSGPEIAVPDSVRDLIADGGLGDARRAYTILERALVLASARGLAELDEGIVEQAAQRKLVLYDKSADAHYDVISAFIKSLRGSDPDAALYYLAVMLTGGEDPKFIARRMVIFASEDVGNADSEALQVAVAVSRAVEFVGLPECRINLAHGVTYLACAPKSNASYSGLEAALAEVREHGGMAPPVFLRSTGYSGAKDLGHGAGYEYPHDSGGYVGQRYLPKELWGREFYSPTSEGHEMTIKQFLERMRTLRRGEEGEPPG